MKGRIHSIESMGLVDGPGIRAVVFLQGCALRCRYCHNPDSWDFSAGEEISADELIEKLIRFKPYFRSGGGVTFSGGEPLMQGAFLLEMLKKCKAAGIHTCIDTAGVGQGNYEEILKYTDLVLFDIKHHDPQEYLSLTGREISESLRFLEVLKTSGTPVWVRHVAVPSITDGDEHFKELSDFISSIPCVEKVELLPYHLLGVHKYKALSIPYSLEGVPAMNADKIKPIEKHINEKIKEKKL